MLDHSQYPVSCVLVVASSGETKQRGQEALCTEWELMPQEFIHRFARTFMQTYYKSAHVEEI